MAAFHAKEERLRDGVENRRDPRDRYETPPEVTDALVDFMGDVLSCMELIVDPCCGTGRVLRRLRTHFPLTMAMGTDIEEHGVDFLAEGYEPPANARPAACVTNPPYKHAREFVERALATFDGPVCMLLPADFMWSEDRRDWLNGSGRPCSQLIIPWRIKFFDRTGKRIPGQAYSHQWVVWPCEDLRPATCTATSWARVPPAEVRRSV